MTTLLVARILIKEHMIKERQTKRTDVTVGVG